jgi:hypothetical protein
MAIQWSREQIFSLAPDDATCQLASNMAAPSRWANLYQHKTADLYLVWGEIKGSGKDPYRCVIHLRHPQFGCTCPSSKRPCKHSLALLLLFAEEPFAFLQAEPPDWVSKWITRNTQAQSGNSGKKQPTKPDPAAQAKRAAARDKKIHAGLDDLEIWLGDMLRQGLAAAQDQPRSYWETAAARLVDAQAQGLARLVRELAAVSTSGDGWQSRMMNHISRLYLALEGYRRIDRLSPDQQADLRSVIGFVQKQEDLAGEAGVSGTWLVLGRGVEMDANLKTQRVWLWEMETHRPAVVLSYAIGLNPLDTSLVPGAALKAKLAFFPSAYPLRAVILSREAAAPLPVNALRGDAASSCLVQATGAYANALACFPWLERFPLLLNNISPLQENSEWVLYDRNQRRTPLIKSFLHGWTLLAMSGGQPIGVFGEWDGKRLLPLSAWANGEFHAFQPRSA